MDLRKERVSTAKWFTPKPSSDITQIRKQVGGETGESVKCVFNESPSFFFLSKTRRKITLLFIYLFILYFFHHLFEAAKGED